MANAVVNVIKKPLNFSQYIYCSSYIRRQPLLSRNFFFFFYNLFINTGLEFVTDDITHHIYLHVQPFAAILAWSVSSQCNLVNWNGLTLRVPIFYFT